MWTTFNAFPHFDRLLDDVMTGAAGSATAQRSYSPAFDIRTNDQEITFFADVPGLKAENLEVSIEKDTLTIKGERKYEGSDKDQVWLGRAFGKFSKAYKLPENVDAENLSAALADGVLTVTVPRKPKVLPRKIQVAIGGALAAKAEETK